MEILFREKDLVHEENPQRGISSFRREIAHKQKKFGECCQTEELEECWVPPPDRSSFFQHFTEQEQSIVANKAILKWFLFLFDGSGVLFVCLLYCLLDFFHNSTFLLSITYCSLSPSCRKNGQCDRWPGNVPQKIYRKAHRGGE